MEGLDTLSFKELDPPAARRPLSDNNALKVAVSGVSRSPQRAHSDAITEHERLLRFQRSVFASELVPLDSLNCSTTSVPSFVIHNPPCQPPEFGLCKRYSVVWILASGMNVVCKVSLKVRATRTRRGTGHCQAQTLATPHPGSTRNLTGPCDARGGRTKKSRSWLIRTKSIRIFTAPTPNRA